LAEYRDWISDSDGAGAGPPDARPNGRFRHSLSFYVHAHSTSVGAYVLEQLVFALCSWIPGLPGVAIRALAYKLLLHSRGWAAIEPGVRICQPRNVTLHDGVYLDQGVYLHACPQGIEIGENTYVMHHAELHVYNFRGLQHSRIRLGNNCIVGEFSVIRGQGGVSVGDNVIIGPRAQIMAVDHIFDDPDRPIIEQGLQALGIEIADNVWIGAGAIVLDGVRIGRGAVVGAGAVVTHDVAPHTVVAGVPARLLRRIPRPRTVVRPPRVEREAVAGR
jgi:acetyltransferase-like isoleucine patch superfamily enzyme